MKRLLNTASALMLFSLFLTSCFVNSGQNEVKLFPVTTGDNYQFIDKEGKILINPQFADASIFREGFALVKTSSDEPKYGYISEDSKFAINAQYKEATVFREGLAWVVAENSAPVAINTKGEIKITMQDAEYVRVFNEGLAPYAIFDSSEVKWGFIDKDGKIKINPQFSNVGNFHEGKCNVENSEGKYGFIDKDGKIVINYQFDMAYFFHNNFAVVELDDKYGVIDNAGKYVINPQYSSIQYDKKMFIIQQDDKWGWCDKEGKIIINPQFNSALPFMNNKLAPVQSGDKWGFINQSGAIVINPQFDAAYSFNGKLALVEMNDKYGFISEDGKYVINPQYTDISSDYFTNLFFGETALQGVRTDYFNLNAVLGAFNVESPEGLSFESTYQDVITKLKISQETFTQGSMLVSVLKKSISRDVSLEFYVGGNPYDSYSVQKTEGWYTYVDTEYKFNGKNKPNRYAYVIQLSGNQAEKVQNLYEAVVAGMGKYKKEVENSDEVDLDLYFSNEKQRVNIYRSGDSVIIDMVDLTASK